MLRKKGQICRERKKRKTMKANTKKEKEGKPGGKHDRK